MEDQIIHKLSSATQEEIIQQIISTYQRQGRAIVNFLYFANAMTYRLFEHDSASFEKEVAHECVTEDFTKITRPKSKVGTLFVKRAVYKQSLLTADFLLPDGIALQVWSQLTAKKKLHNLNGTDLTPALLSYLNQHHKASVYIYSLYDPKIGKGEEWLHKAIANIRHTYPKVHIAFSHQSVYSNRGKDFPFDEMKKISEADSDSDIKLFVNATGTPFQEMRTMEYKDFFEKEKMLVMNVGGWIDFMAGYEKRAPRWVVKARVLETFWRVASNPRKNLKKLLAMFGIFRILLQKLRLKKIRS